MSLTVSEIARAVESVAPLSLAEPWDRPGLQLGDPRARVRTVLVALDPSPAAVAAALSQRAELLLTHHPLFLEPLARIDLSTPLGRKIRDLLTAGVAVYCAHTNLDRALGGVNDRLAAKLGLVEVEPLPDSGKDGPGLGRVGRLPDPVPLAEFAREATGLSAPTARVVGDPLRRVERVAVCGGSGASLWPSAQEAGAQVLVTGDVRHHAALDAREAGMALVDVGHAVGERCAVEALAEAVQAVSQGDQRGVKVVVLEEDEPWSPVRT
ncbi:MAG: Nif3-like dinuclear metal center hexameric protein [Deltaproteobacteria bacterium]|nr:Nif3-like dinuclear metal center hexameric protein [Deltaproteobacteria bacterium]